jgi:hypothetical protein
MAQEKLYKYNVYERPVANESDAVPFTFSIS